MPISKTGIYATTLLAFALAGCQSDRFGSLPGGGPQPIAPSSGTLGGTQLPPPSQATAPGQFPAAPSQPGLDPQMAAIDPSAQTGPAAGAPEVSKSSLLGSWSVNSGGSSCQMFLTLTKYGNASRGGTRGCSNELANMRSWDVAGSQLVVHDENGNTIARLYSSGASRLDGQTTGGAPVSLSR